MTEADRTAGTGNVADTEQQLVDRCRRGDQDAWRELVSQHASAVFGLCYRMVGRVDQAEDLTQETFTRVFQQLDRYQSGQGAFGAWLMAVSRNLAIDHWRRMRHERGNMLGDGSLANLASRGDTPERLVERRERVHLVRRGLRGLKPDLRLPIVLRDLAGLSYEEIGRTLALPVGTVKSRINRARIELARRLVGLENPPAVGGGA